MFFFLNKWAYRLLYFQSRLWSIDPLREENTSLLPQSSGAFLISNTYLSASPFPISSSPPLSLLHLPFPRNQQAQPPLRLQKPASLSASATLLQRLVLHASHQSTCFIGHTVADMHTGCVEDISLITIYSLKSSVGSRWQPQCSLTWAIHGYWALWLRLVCPFRSLAHAHPSVPSALLSHTLAPSGLFLSYFLRPPHLTTPLDPTPPHPHQRFLAGRFVFICIFINLLFFSILTLLLLCFVCFTGFIYISQHKH